jgi:hypothetical protein
MKGRQYLPVNCVSTLENIGAYVSMETHSIQVMIRNPYQRVKMVRETQYWWEGIASIWELPSTRILHIEKRIQRVFDRDDIIRRHNNTRHGYRHV